MMPKAYVVDLWEISSKYIVNAILFSLWLHERKRLLDGLWAQRKRRALIQGDTHAADILP